MQVKDVDGRDRVVGQDQVRSDADYPAVDLRLRNLAAAELDDVLPRPNVERAVCEVELLRDACCRRLRRARRGVAGNAEDQNNDRDDPTSHRGTIAGPRDRRKQSESGGSTRAYEHRLPKGRPSFTYISVSPPRASICP